MSVYKAFEEAVIKRCYPEKIGGAYYNKLFYLRIHSFHVICGFILSEVSNGVAIYQSLHLYLRRCADSADVLEVFSTTIQRASKDAVDASVTAEVFNQTLTLRTIGVNPEKPLMRPVWVLINGWIII